MAVSEKFNVFLILHVPKHLYVSSTNIQMLGYMQNEKNI